MKRHIVCATIVFFLSMTNAVGMAQQEISWECFEMFKDRTTPLIKVLAVNDIGIIETNGISKTTAYRQQGLTHRWNFDLNESDNTYDAAFIIEPDGTGQYIYFGDKKTAKASLITQCEIKK